MDNRLTMIKKYYSDFGEIEQRDFDWLIYELERQNNWNKGNEQLAIDHYKLEKELDAIKEMMIINSNLVVKYEDALREIDCHILSTTDPVQYIIETLKKTLPEYNMEEDGENSSLHDWLR